MEILFTLATGTQHVVLEENDNKILHVTVIDTDRQPHKFVMVGVDLDTASNQGDEYWKGLLELLKKMFVSQYGYELKTREI